MALFSSESCLCFNEADESFTTYEERFAQFIEANGIEEGKQRAVFLSVVGAKTFSLLTDLVAPKKPSETPLADILKALRDFYVWKKNVVSERYSFRARKQQSGESLAEYVPALKGLAASCEFGLMLEEQLRDQLVYGISSEELRTKLLSAAHGEQLNWAKVMDIVNNFECTTTSLRTFQQTPLRTDSVSSHEGKACARGTAEKTHDREEILGDRETTFNRWIGEEHPARETANQSDSSGSPWAFPESTTAEGETLHIAKEPASMGPRATGLRHQSAHTNRESATKGRYTSGDSRRPPGSSSQTDLEEPKKDDRIQGANKIKNPIKNENIFTPLSPGNPAIYKLNLKSTGNDQFCIKDFGSKVTVAGVQPLIQIGLSKLNEIQETRAALHQHQSAINANKDFTYEVEISVPKQVSLLVGVYVTNCLTCNYTCHDHCGYANDADKIRCVAMKNSYCTVCPGKCIWNMHRNMTYKIVTEIKKETRTYENLRKQYEEALGKKLSAEEIVKQLEKDYEDVQFDVFQRTDEMARCLHRLQEIALRPDPLSTPGYIELLIEAEMRECKPGYQKRVAELQNVLKGAVIVNKVAK